MERHIFLDKTCTIFKGSKANTGLNPVAELNYGRRISRVLLHFPIDDIRNIAGESETEKKYILHLKNCASLMTLPYYRGPVSASGDERERASSCSVLLFRVPRDFDAGRGFDYANDFSIHSNKSYTENGCNWYQSDNGNDWNYGGSINLAEEYEKYKNPSESGKSLIIAEQHFDFGNEDFEFDITSYVEGVLDEKWRNHGLGLCFTPGLEGTKTDVGQYLGFFTDHTNTFFLPYVKVTMDDAIIDNRTDFYLGVENKLYLSLYGDGILIDLDENPVCTIDGTEYPVTKCRRGVYYATVSLAPDSYESNRILYDEWSNIKFMGKELKPIENSFEVKDAYGNFTINRLLNPVSVVPCVEGVNDSMEIRRDEIVPVAVNFRKKYSTNETISIPNAEYRIYVKDGNNREVSILDWQVMDKYDATMSFNVYASDLIPGEYFVDIRTPDGNIFKGVWSFIIVSQLRFAYL